MKKRNKIYTKLLSIALVCVMLVTSMGAYSGDASEKEIKQDGSEPILVSEGRPSAEKSIGNNIVMIKAIQDISYQEHSVGTNQMVEEIEKAGRVFERKWGYTFSSGVYNVVDNTLESHDCKLTTNKYCTTESCGSKCENKDIILSNHHKNIFAMHDDVKQKKWINEYDLQIFATTDATCYTDKSEHKQGGYAGLGDVNGNHTILIANNGANHLARLIQHELSHNFGCLDNACTDGFFEDCIMKGSFDGDINFDNENIWCTGCTETVNKNKF